MSNTTSYDAEGAVLNILVEHPEMVFELTNLKKEMFSSIANQQLFEHIQRVMSNGNIPDRQLIEIQIREYPEFSEHSDFNYLQYILSLHYAKENFYEYVRMVADAYKSRELTRLANSLSGKVRETPNVSDLIEKLKQDLEIISDVTGGEGTSHISELIPGVLKEIEMRRETPNTINWSTGFANFDMFTGGFKPGNVLIIAARPSVGKTAWLCNSILKSASTGVKSLVFEHEMNKQDLIDRLLATFCNIPLIGIRTGNISRDTYPKITAALEYFKTLPIFLDTTFGSDINYLKATTRKFVKIHNVSTIYVDYIQLMVERTDNMTMALGNVSRELKILATKLGIQFIVLSQLNRNVEGREDKRPTLADLRQSGNLEEDADMVAILFRTDMYRDGEKPKTVPLEFNVKKNRNGPIGLLPMKMNLETNDIVGDF